MRPIDIDEIFQSNRTGAGFKSVDEIFRPHAASVETSTIAAKGALSPETLDDVVLYAVKDYPDVDPALLRALILHESGGNPNAVPRDSNGNLLSSAYGLGQLTKSTQEEMDVKNPLDPYENARGAAGYLNKQLKAFGNEEAALAAYFRGPSAVKSHLMFDNNVRNMQGNLGGATVSKYLDSIIGIRGKDINRQWNPQRLTEYREDGSAGYWDDVEDPIDKIFGTARKSRVWVETRPAPPQEVYVPPKPELQAEADEPYSLPKYQKGSLVRDVAKLLTGTAPDRIERDNYHRGMSDDEYSEFLKIGERLAQTQKDTDNPNEFYNTLTKEEQLALDHYRKDRRRIDAVDKGVLRSIPLSHIAAKETAAERSLREEYPLSTTLGGVAGNVGGAMVGGGLVAKGLSKTPLIGNAMAKSSLLRTAAPRTVTSGALSATQQIGSKTEFEEGFWNSVQAAGGGLVSVIPEIFLPAGVAQLIGQPLADLAFDYTVDSARGADTKSAEWWRNEALSLGVSMGFAVKDVASGQTFRLEQAKQRGEIKGMLRGWKRGKGKEGFELVDESGRIAEQEAPAGKKLEGTRELIDEEPPVRTGAGERPEQTDFVPVDESGNVKNWNEFTGTPKVETGTAKHETLRQNVQTDADPRKEIQSFLQGIARDMGFGGDIRALNSNWGRVSNRDVKAGQQAVEAKERKWGEMEDRIHYYAASNPELFIEAGFPDARAFLHDSQGVSNFYPLDVLDKATSWDLKTGGNARKAAVNANPEHDEGMRVIREASFKSLKGGLKAHGEAAEYFGMPADDLSGINLKRAPISELPKDWSGAVKFTNNGEEFTARFDPQEKGWKVEGYDEIFSPQRKIWIDDTAAIETAPRYSGAASYGEYPRNYRSGADYSKTEPSANETRAKFDALPAPEVSSDSVKKIFSATPDETGGKSLTSRVRDWVSSKNLFGKYVNDDTGWGVEFNKASAENVAIHGAGPQKVALMEATPDLIETGVYLETIPKNNQGLKTHVFAGKATIDGEPYAVSFAVREDGSGKRYYDHSLTKIEALNHIDDRAPQAARGEPKTEQPTNGSNPASMASGGTPMGKQSLSDILKKHIAVKEGGGRVSRGATPPATNNIRNTGAEVNHKIRGGISEANKSDFGDTPIKSTDDADLRPLDLPEAVSLLDNLGINVRIKKTLRDGAKGRAIFDKDGKGVEIQLDANLPKDKEGDQAKKTLFHEMGHIMSLHGGSGKGKAVATKIKNVTHLFNQLIENGPDAVMLTKSERNKIRKDAVRKLGTNATGEQKRAAHQKALDAELEARGLTHLKKIYNELYEFSKNKWRPFDETKDPAFTKYRSKGEEVFADAVSAYFYDPAFLKQEAPTFWKVFHNWEEARNPFSQLYREIQNLYSKGEDAVTEKRSQNSREGFDEYEKNTKDTRDKEAAEAKEKGGLLGVGRAAYKWLVERNDSLERLVKNVEKSGAKIAAKVNPYLNRRAQKFVKSEQTAYMLDVRGAVESVVGKLNPETTKDFGEYLMHARISMGDRGEIWNPFGHTAETSKKQLDHLKKRVGDERYKQLEDAAQEFAKMRQEYIIKAIVESGAFSKEFVEKMLGNTRYATFEVLRKMVKEYGADAVRSITGTPVGAHKQTGTLKEIRNPFLATIENDMKMLAFIDRNNLNRNTVNLLTEHSNTLGFEAKPARRRSDGSVIVRDSQDKDYRTVFVLENGKRKAYDVSAPIAASIANNPKKALAELQFFDKVNNYFRNVLTQKNPAFWVWNLQRDFRRFHRNIEGSALRKAWQVYKAYPEVFGYVTQGKMTENIREALKDRAMLPASAYSKDSFFDIDSEFYRQLASFGTEETKTAFLGRQWNKLMRGLDTINDTMELATKLAGYNYLKQDKRYSHLSPEERAHLVRTRIGTPDIYAGGDATTVTNKLFMFSNVAIQGMREDFNVIRENPKRAALLTIMYDMLPAAIGVLAGNEKLSDFADWLGLGYEQARWLEGAYAKIPAFDKVYRQAIPLPFETTSGKQFYIPLPKSETGMLLQGVTYHVMNAMFQDNAEDVFDEIKSIGGDIFGLSPIGFGSLHPALKVGLAWSQYGANQNPHDFYFNRPVIRQKDWQVNTARELKAMGAWTLNNIGGNVVMRIDDDILDFKNKDWFEIALGLPILGNPVGRFVRVSDRGLEEKKREQKLDERRDKDKNKQTAKSGKAQTSAIWR